MAKIMQYVSTPAGRDKLMKDLTLFSVVGGTVVSTILFLAVYLR